MIQVCTCNTVAAAGGVDYRCPIHGNPPESHIYMSPCENCAQLKKSLEEQSRDYAQRHIGFETELSRLLGRIELLENIIRESAPLRWAHCNSMACVREAEAWEKKAFDAVK